MKHLVQLLAIGLLCGLMATLVARRFLSESAPDSPSERVPAVPAPVAKASPSNEAILRGKPDENTVARVKELEKMELLRSQREQAAEKMHEARAKLQFYKHRDWTEVIQAHRQEFKALREAAVQWPLKKIPCTICDAKGVLDLCVVCEHTGKCPTCRGTGKNFDEICAACSGSGKCFLCSGSGKMPCPFCQSSPLWMELITAGTPDPAAEIPID